MAEEPTDESELDEADLGPFVDVGADPPGRFVEGVWRGPLHWRTRHGPAVVSWSLGRPVAVSACLHAGARVSAQWTLWADVFRVRRGEGFLHGRIGIGGEDVAFTPLAEEHVEPVAEDLLTLLDLLRADAAFMRDMQEASFAAALYAVIENQDFVAPSNSTFGARRYTFGQRSAARFVARLRGRGEIYLDYAWGRGPDFTGAERKAAAAHLARLGLSLAPIEGTRT